MRPLLPFLASLIISLSGNCQTDSITVVSWNVFLRPAILGDKQVKRVDSISNYLHSTSSDVIILQEVFHKRSRRKLVKSLESKYPYYTRKGPKSFWGVPSGVLILSKNTISDYDKISFKNGINADKLAAKGGVYVETSINSIPIAVIGTHLQAGGGDEGADVRTAQVSLLNELLTKKDSSLVTIFAGDFNIRYESDAYNNLLDTLNCNSIEPQGPIKSTSNLPGHTFTETSGAPNWIDFIFLRETLDAKLLGSWIEEPRSYWNGHNSRLSDHNPIYTVIQLNSSDK